MISVTVVQNKHKPALLPCFITLCSENMRDLVERLVSRTLYSNKIINMLVDPPIVFESECSKKRFVW